MESIGASVGIGHWQSLQPRHVTTETVLQRLHTHQLRQTLFRAELIEANHQVAISAVELLQKSFQGNGACGLNLFALLSTINLDDDQTIAMQVDRLF